MTSRVVTTAARPTAVVICTTTWAEFSTIWMTLLDQVYGFLKGSDVRIEEAPLPIGRVSSICSRGADEPARP